MMAWAGRAGIRGECADCRSPPQTHLFGWAEARAECGHVGRRSLQQRELAQLIGKLKFTKFSGCGWQHDGCVRYRGCVFCLS